VWTTTPSASATYRAARFGFFLRMAWAMRATRGMSGCRRSSSHAQRLFAGNACRGHGWNGEPAGGEHVFVDRVEKAIATAMRSRRPGRQRRRRSDRRPGAQSRTDRSGGHQPGPCGFRLRPPVRRHALLGARGTHRASVMGEPPIGSNVVFCGDQDLRHRRRQDRRALAARTVT
jgi:hypothetical protein